MMKMHCSSCGTAVTPALSYCNRCGAELKAKEHGSTNLFEVPTESLVWAITTVTIVGLGAVIGIMAVMKEVLHFNEGLIILFTLLSFVTFLGVDSVFIWLLLRSRMVGKEASGKTQEKELTTSGLGKATARALAEPALSVTEHTTRTLEPVDRQHKRE
jgi:hypothetical protein